MCFLFFIRAGIAATIMCYTPRPSGFFLLAFMSVTILANTLNYHKSEGSWTNKGKLLTGNLFWTLRWGFYISLCTDTPVHSGKTSAQSGICTHLHPKPSPFLPQQLGCSVVWSLLCYWVRARDHCVFFVINSCYSLGILCTSPQPRMVSFDYSIGSLKRSTKKKVNCSIMELTIVYLGCWVLVVQCLLFCVLRMVFSIVELSPVFRRAKHQDTKLEAWYKECTLLSTRSDKTVL